GGDQPIHDALSRLGGHRHNCHLDLFLTEHLFHLGIRKNRSAPPATPDLLRIGIEDGADHEAALLEVAIGDEGTTDLSRSDEGYLPAAIQPENSLQRSQQLRHRITEAPLAERAEKGEVLAHLRRCRATTLRQLLAGDGGLARG